MCKKGYLWLSVVFARPLTFVFPEYEHAERFCKKIVLFTYNELVSFANYILGTDSVRKCSFLVFNKRTISSASVGGGVWAIYINRFRVGMSRIRL